MPSQELRSKIGWNALGYAISLCIVAIAASALFQLARDIEPARIAEALRGTPLSEVAIAGGLVAASYVTLTFYEFFALRTIGCHIVPYRTAALSSFTSYSIGHNVGAMVFTAALVRFRIYSSWGLGLIDIAKIAFVTGLTFWLGNTFVLACAMLYDPNSASAIDQVPPRLNQALGLVGILVIIAYLAWLNARSRVLGRQGWQVVLPSARLTLVQIGIGALDLVLVALAMDSVLPADPPIAFVTVLCVFVAAMLLGFASHTPGSLGVFEAAMLVGLADFDKERLIAALLIFRLLYFILPLLLALATLGVRELWRTARPAPS